MYLNVESTSSAAMQFLDESVTLNTGWQDSSSSLSGLPNKAAGDITEGYNLVQLHSICTSLASEAFNSLSGTLEQASEALQQCVRAFSSLDEETAERFRVK